MPRDMASAIGLLKTYLEEAEAIVIGAGAGLSAAAGFVYGGDRFQEHFGDFVQAYGMTDMYQAGFYPFDTLEEQWAFWSRMIWVNRYTSPPKPVYDQLLDIVRDKNYFVLTTNTDHCFQRAGFDKDRLFYTQGDYGLWQCSLPCHQETYDNKDQVQAMVQAQEDRRIPSDLIPYCPKCQRPMAMNLRADQTFVEDEGWHRARDRYQAFINRHETGRVLYWELGVGENTPAIIKFPFWAMTSKNPEARYVCLNKGQAYGLAQMADQAVYIDGDIADVLPELLESW